MTIDYRRYSSTPYPFMACKLKIDCFMAKHSYTFYLACYTKAIITISIQSRIETAVGDH